MQGRRKRGLEGLKPPLLSEFYGKEKNMKTRRRAPITCLFYNIKPRIISLEVDQPIIKEWNKAPGGSRGAQAPTPLSEF